MAGDGSTFAVVAAGLDMRRRAGVGPLTVLSCDNVISNGDVARNSLARRGRATRPSHWPSGSSRSLRFRTAWSIASRRPPARPIENGFGPTAGSRIAGPSSPNHFVNGSWKTPSPAIDRLWRSSTSSSPSDVEPYELAKLRLLNAGHSECRLPRRAGRHRARPQRDGRCLLPNGTWERSSRPRPSRCYRRSPGSSSTRTSTR